MYDDSIGYPTARTSRNIIRFLHTHLRPFDITPEQWTVLKHVMNHSGLTQKELSSLTDKDKATVTRILDILDRKQLISKQLNQEDKRSMLIHITDQGRRQVAKLTPYIEQLFGEKLLKGITAQQLEVYMAVLAQINENIADDLDKLN